MVTGAACTGFAPLVFGASASAAAGGTLRSFCVSLGELWLLSFLATIWRRPSSVTVLGGNRISVNQECPFGCLGVLHGCHNKAQEEAGERGAP